MAVGTATLGRRSSFHESLALAWGLFGYWRATREPDARAAALRTAELFLEHRLFRSLRTRAVIRRDWLVRPGLPPRVTELMPMTGGQASSATFRTAAPAKRP